MQSAYYNAIYKMNAPRSYTRETKNNQWTVHASCARTSRVSNILFPELHENAPVVHARDSARKYIAQLHLVGRNLCPRVSVQTLRAGLRPSGVRALVGDTRLSAAEPAPAGTPTPAPPRAPPACAPSAHFSAAPTPSCQAAASRPRSSAQASRTRTRLGPAAAAA